VDGTTLIQRDDDKAETVLNRLTVYHAKTAPLIDFYQKAGLLRSVNAADAPEAVTAAVLAALEASR
jgi:adenylate kinase